MEGAHLRELQGLTRKTLIIVMKKQILLLPQRRRMLHRSRFCLLPFLDPIHYFFAICKIEVLIPFLYQLKGVTEG